VVALLRCTKRYASFELDDIDEIINLEFRLRSGEPDLSLSVYEIAGDQASIVRLHCERTASYRDPKPKEFAATHLDVTGLGPRGPIADDDDDEEDEIFSNLRESHRTIEFLGEEELRAFVLKILANIPARNREIALGEVSQFILERVEAKNAEWEKLLAAKPKWASWFAKELQKKKAVPQGI
jgi:hypothetical protein